jgi:hypothetical protein
MGQRTPIPLLEGIGAMTLPEMFTARYDHRLADIPIKPSPDVPGAWTMFCECGYGGIADSPEAAAVALGRHLDPKPTGVEGALAAVSDLREALSTIRIRSPQYAPGTEPTKADMCKQILEMIEHGIRQIETATQPPLFPDNAGSIIGAMFTPPEGDGPPYTHIIVPPEEPD